MITIDDRIGSKDLTAYITAPHRLGHLEFALLASNRVRPLPDPQDRAPLAELRLTLSGIVPKVRGLSYRAMANYATASRGPYVAGPVTSALPTQSQPQLIPIDRFRGMVGVEYEF